MYVDSRHGHYLESGGAVISDLWGLDQDRLLNSTGFSLAFARRGKLLTVPSKPVLLGAADATGEANLAAHRCSNFLCR
jgi:hypothetical protein